MLSQEEKNRYARHFTLKQVGLAGQEQLKRSSVLCIGTGGLGSPAAMYLAAAGVGKLGLIDCDTVESSNLQRQILHGESDIGRSKLQSAKETLLEINPHIDVVLHETRFSAANAMELVQQYDVIVDGSDNFPTRFASNDACVLLKTPNVYGSIYQFEGQVSVFAPHINGPCYRCMLSEPPPPGSVPSCAEAGVLGVLPGIIGSMQAMEAIKLCLNIGEPPLGKLLYYSALSSSVREIRLKQDPQCCLCGESPSIEAPIHYDDSCPMNNSAIPLISAEELKSLISNGYQGTIIDVREPDERVVSAIEPSTLIPLKSLEPHLDKLDKDDEYIVYCAGGIRSAKAVELMLSNGFKKIHSLDLGMKAWTEL